MELKTYFAQDASGNIIPNVQVFVYLAGTTTLASGIVDQNGAPLTNPFNADSSAAVVFAAPDGDYDVKCSGASRTVTIRAQLFDGGAFKADLAATGGSALVGYDGDTAQTVLDNAKAMANYTALRAYTGRATGVRITQAGLAGFFQRDDADTTSADNGGTIIVDGSGRRWKRLYSGFVNLLWFGADRFGNTDSSAVILSAVSLGQAVYAPSGTYLSSIQNLPSNTYIFGDGETTIIKPLTVTARCAIGADSGSASAFVDNVTLRDLKLLGDVATQGFYEQAHLVSFNGVRNLLIERVHFVGFRGDGIYLGSGNTGGQERHNVNVTIRNCVFDGVNKDNRNAISVVDGDGVHITGNVFKNCTRPGMPGAVDIEPNMGQGPWFVCRDINIIGNRFSNVGGDNGIVFNTQSGAMVTPLRGVAIDNNTFDETNTFSMGAVFIWTVENLATVPPMDISITRNKILSTTQPILLRFVNGATVEGNYIRNGITVTMGRENSASLSIKNLKFSNNQLIDVSNTSCAMSVATCENVDISHNTFKPKDVTGHITAIMFYGNGVTTTSTNVSICNNIFQKGSAQTYAIRAVGHTFLTPMDNVFDGNIVGAGLINQFSNQSFGTWTPALTFSTPGDLNAVYSAASGTYSKSGRVITCSFSFTTTTWAYSTASGTARITGLPVAASSAVPAQVGNIFGAGYTSALSNLACDVQASGTVLRLISSGSGAGTALFTSTNLPSGTQQSYEGTITYIV